MKPSSIEELSIHDNFISDTIEFGATAVNPEGGINVPEGKLGVGEGVGVAVEVGVGEAVVLAVGEGVNVGIGTDGVAVGDATGEARLGLEKGVSRGTSLTRGSSGKSEFGTLNLPVLQSLFARISSCHTAFSFFSFFGDKFSACSFFSSFAFNPGIAATKFLEEETVPPGG